MDQLCCYIRVVMVEVGLGGSGWGGGVFCVSVTSSCLSLSTCTTMTRNKLTGAMSLSHGALCALLSALPMSSVGRK